MASSRSMTKIAGSGSGSISQRHGSADPDTYQFVADPQHCRWQYKKMSQPRSVFRFVRVFTVQHKKGRYYSVIINEIKKRFLKNRLMTKAGKVAEAFKAIKTLPEIGIRL